MKPKEFALGRLWGFTCLLCLCACASASAQTLLSAATATTGPSVNTPSFREQLKKLAEQNHVVCLVEGALPRDDAAPGALPQTAPGAAEADPLDVLAQRFDYRVERLPGNLIVLHKTYYDERGLPSVTLDECIGSLKDIERVLEAANPHIPNPPSNPLMDTFASFNEAQFAAMQRGWDEAQTHGIQTAASPPIDSGANIGLPVVSLSPAQKQGIGRIARFLYIQFRATDIAPSVKEISALISASPTFVLRDVSGVRLFGYETKEKFTPLSDPYHLPTEFDTAASYNPSLKGIKDTIPSGYDPTLPKRTEPAGDGKTDIITLQALAEQLNRRASANAAEPGKTVTIDRELAEKRLTVIGEWKNTDAPAVLQAVAALYGLQVANGPTVIKVTRPRARISDDPVQAWKSVGQLLPLPLQTAYLQKARPGDPGLQKIIYTANRSTINPASSYEGDTFLKWVAVRRLRQTVEDKINKASNKKVSFDELDADEQQAFAVTVMAPYLRHLVEFAHYDPPPFIKNFNQAVLIGSFGNDAKGRKWFSFNIGHRLPNGNLQPGQAGFSAPVDTP